MRIIDKIFRDKKGNTVIYLFASKSVTAIQSIIFSSGFILFSSFEINNQYYGIYALIASIILGRASGVFLAPLCIKIIEPGLILLFILC